MTLAGLAPNGAPFMTNPTSCLAATATMRAVSYDDPGSPATRTAAFTPTECGTLPFSAGLSVTPDTSLAEAPTGAEIALSVDPGELPRRHAHVRRATVRLPPGLAVNPALASGLAGCDEPAFQRGDGCPGASDIGDLTLATPPLGELAGDIYFAAPTPAHPWRLLLELRLPGARGRLVGDLALDPGDGRITAVFAELPQVPFTRFALRFRGGPRGAFVTPAACGTHGARAELEPWTRATHAAPPNATPGASFQTSFDGAGAPCPNPLPFAPTLSAAVAPDTAGGSPTLTLGLARPDRHQRLRAVGLHLPPGLLGRLTLPGLTRCPLAVAARGACAAASRIGSVTAAVGAGAEPVSLAGQLYLTESAGSELAGLSLTLSGRVGPIDLGDVIVPARIELRDGDLGLDIGTGELPRIKGGVPLPIRSLSLRVDRAGFLIAPSACGARTIGSDVTGSGGSVARPTATISFRGCEALPFAPSFEGVIEGTTRDQPVPVRMAVTLPPGHATLRDTRVTLPAALGPNLGALARACPRSSWDAGSCPATARVGTASATSPAIDRSLQGPILLVREEGELLPRLGISLGGPASVRLLGRTELVAGGRLVALVEGAPEVPLERFELALDGGPGGLLSLREEPCQPSAGLTGAVDLTSHSGASATLAPRYRVEGCGQPTTGGETAAGGTPVSSGPAGGSAAPSLPPRAALVLRWRRARGALTGRVRAARGAAALTRVRIVLPRGVSFRGRRTVTVRARGGAARTIRVRIRGLRASRRLRPLLAHRRRRPPVLRLALRIRDADGGSHRLRIRLRPRR